MNNLKRHLKLWPEWFSLPAGLLLWVASPYILQWYDPTAATFDAGVFQAIVFSIMCMLIGNGLAFMGILFNFKTLFEFYEFDLSVTFKNLTPWQKVLSLLLLYFGLLLVFSLFLIAIL